MQSRIYKFLIIHNCIYELQFGLHKECSTNHALLSLTEDIQYAPDNYFAGGVFIDLQNVFDTVDDNILLRELYHYRIRDKANDWLKSYLTNFTQFVSINEFNSEELTMKFGVPQDSLLCPLLFLVYINDIHAAITFSATRPQMTQAY